MKEGSAWIVRHCYNANNEFTHKILYVEYTDDAWETSTKYHVQAIPTENGVRFKVEKVNPSAILLEKEITPIKDENDIFLQVRPNWYKGFTYDFKESEYMNKRLNFLFKDSIINVLIDILDINSSKEHLGQYSTKYENPEESLLSVLSSNLPKKRRIIHTKSFTDILNHTELYPSQGMELDGRLITAVQDLANRDFEIVEDIRECDKDFFERNLANKDTKKSNVEFYKVRPLNKPDSAIMELSAFMIYTIREAE